MWARRTRRKPKCKLRRSSLRPARPPRDGQHQEAAQTLRDPGLASPAESGAGGGGIWPPGARPRPVPSHSRISARASARGCSPWLLRPRPPALSAPAPGSARPWAGARVWPRAPAPVTARTRRAVRGAAAAPQRSCPARPLAGAVAAARRWPLAGAVVAARRWRLLGGGGCSAVANARRRLLGGSGCSAVVASRPGCWRWGCRLGGRPRGTCRGSAPQLLSSALLPFPLLPGPPPAAPLSPASGRRSGAHVTSACEHAPRGPRPPPRQLALARRGRRALGPPSPRPGLRRSGREPAEERTLGRGAEGRGRQVGTTPCCFRLRGGLREPCPGGRGGGGCAPSPRG